MGNCKNCGQLLADNALFCHICGTPVDKQEQTDSSMRKQEYVGVVKKCPSCGAELPSMVAVCPSCGHEIMSSEVAPFLSAFIDGLDKCDQAIIEEESERRKKNEQKTIGWKSWNKIGKIAWIVLNIATLCFPLLLFFVIMRFREASILPSEKLKASLIDNFEIPNEKGAIIDSLNLIQGKIASVTAGRATNRSWHWTKIWYAKASQISKKGSVLLPGEKSINDSFCQINEHYERFQKKIRFKNGALLTGTFIYILLVLGSIWFLSSRGLSPFIQISNSGVLVSPYLWKVYIPLILTLCILIVPKIPKEIRLYFALLPWIAVLIILFGGLITSCSEKAENKRETETTLAGDVENIGEKYDLVLVQFKVKNRFKDEVEITFQSPSFDRESIIDAENEIKRANGEYHYVIELSFVTEDDLVVRKVKIDEHNILKVEEDNTDGFLAEFVNLCKENDLKITYCMKWNDYGMYHFTLRPTTNEEKDYTGFSDEAEKLMLKYGYSSIEITIEDLHGKDIVRINIEIGSDIEIVQVAEIEGRVTENITPILKKYGLTIDWVSLGNNELIIVLTTQVFDDDQIMNLAEEIAVVCIETGYDTRVDIKEDNNIVWRIHCDEFGRITTIDASETDDTN